MSVIKVSIIRAPERAANPHTTMTFSASGGTIGRSADNRWALDDPQRFVSGVHAQIVSEGGRFYLADLSTNGTFYNSSPEPVGRGNRVCLSDGDTFALGEYEFKVSLQAEQGGVAGGDLFPSRPSSAAVASGPFADLGLMGGARDDAFLFPVADAGSSWTAAPPASQDGAILDDLSAETDPLALLDKGTGSLFAPPAAVLKERSAAGSYYDGAGAMSQSYTFPGAIPENWDDDFSPVTHSTSSHVEHAVAAEPVDGHGAYIRELEQRVRELEEKNQALEAQVQLLQARPAVAPLRSRNPAARETGLILSLGLERYNLGDEKVEAIHQLSGEFIRTAIAGMMQALGYKNSIKNEFRMNVTTIQPVENNPLNFSANVDDAIENMFIKEGNAYKKPVDAMREGMQSIVDHQVALLAGVRAGFNGGIEKFNPDALESRFNRYQKSGLIQVGRKARQWEFYRDYYVELISDMDGSFRYLFGDKFVSAYEDQLHKLTLSRKADTK